MLLTYHIIVVGKVQGVYYRQSTKEKAKQTGLTGTVMNSNDGNVIIEASGTKEQLIQLLDWCKQGPPDAIVTSVVAEERAYQAFEGFIIKR